MGLFPPIDDNALYVSRTDPLDALGSFSKHGFDLDDHHWHSVEHYYQAMKFANNDYQQTICKAATPKKARKLGRTRFKRIRSDWKKVKETVMTRAIYIKCRTHPDIAQQLIDTGDQIIVESTQYDYYWGCGRDRRGNNAYGKVLMRVRDKLIAEQNDNSGSNSG